MRYSTEPRDTIYVTGYGFLCIAKNIGKNLRNKYGRKLLDRATDTIKTASKRAIQKTTGATGDLIGNKIANKIMSVSKKSDAKIEVEVGAASPTDGNKASLKDIPKKRYISPEES